MSKHPRVLIAEDDTAVAKAISRVLSLDCDIVGSITDGSAVLEAVERLQPDVVVLDLNLPNVNGSEACRQITRLNLPTKVIVFTAMNDPEIRRHCLEAGAFAFVSKIAGDGDLTTAVKACVRTPATLL